MDEKDSAWLARQAHAAALLAAADRILTDRENLPSGNRPPTTPHLSLRQASLLTRLAAALLLEPDFPDLPAGFERFLDRERARLAARQLAKSPGRESRAFTRKKAEPAPRNPGVPLTGTDRRLGRETTATLRQWETVRRELLNEYLPFPSDSTASGNQEVQAASLALLDRYWRSRQRLLQITAKPTSQSSPQRSKAAHLHPPAWKHDVTWELWQTFDQRYLFWSDPLPSLNQAPLSQQP